MTMDARFYLEKAQEAEAFADAAFSETLRCHWEYIAAAYRRLAHQAAGIRHAQDRHDAFHKDAAP